MLTLRSRRRFTQAQHDHPEFMTDKQVLSSCTSMIFAGKLCKHMQNMLRSEIHFERRLGNHRDKSQQCLHTPGKPSTGIREAHAGD